MIKRTAPRRFLSAAVSAAVSAALILCSVEPALSQVRVIAAESLGSPAGQTALPRNPALAPAALSGSSAFDLGHLSSFAAAPAWSAASLPVAAAGEAPAAAVPAAAISASAAGAPAEAASSLSPTAPMVEARKEASSLETLARPDEPNAAQGDFNGKVFFDAAHPIFSALAVAGFARLPSAALEPRGTAGNASAAERAQTPAPVPAPSKARSLASKFLWGAGALALPVLTFGWMSFFKSAAPTAASSFTDWFAIARGVAFAGPLVVLAVWEAAKYYRSKKQGSLPWMSRLQVAKALHKSVLPRLNHYLTNLAFGAVGIAMIAIFAGPHINNFNHFLDVHNVGLLRWLHVGGWKNVAAGITILDFMGWWWHYACHRFPLMWRLHKVHHSDVEYNFSTTYRTHWAEMAAEILGRMVMYAIVGPSLLTITIYEIIILGLAQYQHANIKMPERLEAALSRLIMTSHKHFIHHSLDVDDYDSNYGFIFTFWDKLFGTYKSYSPDHLSNKISTGIREYPRAQDLTFFKLLWMPFRSQHYPAKTKVKP
jgi:sterol desaturase/sphingolipid hydroxylase (fatty acid hydroxylase superfamily)